MIVVDTNVVSEPMRPSPAPEVREWVRARASSDLCTTAVTIAEIRYRLERLAGGRRKQNLLIAATEIFAAFGDCILPFDAGAATWYATIVAPRSTGHAHRRVRRPGRRHLQNPHRDTSHAQHRGLPGNRDRRHRPMAAKN